MFCLLERVEFGENEVNMSDRNNVMSGREEITIDSLFVNDDDESNKVESKCISEKFRREQENVYIEELARLVSSQLADIHSFTVRPDRCIILQESLEQMKLLKNAEENDSEVSSSNPTKFGPVFLEALEGFLLVINQSSIIDFASENVSNFVALSQNELIGKSVYQIIHTEDQQKLNSYLTEGALTWSENETSANVGKRSRTFNLKVLANGLRWERMSFVSVLMPFPRETDDENCLLCVVRRVALNLNKDIDQFSTRLSIRGEILGLDVSGVASVYSDLLSQHLIGKKLQDLVHPADVNKFATHLKQVLNSNVSISSELYRLRLLDDDFFIKIQSKSRRYQQQDTILAVHSVCRETETTSLSSSSSSSSSSSLTTTSSTLSSTSMFSVSASGIGPSLSPPIHQSNDFSLNDCLGLNELYPSSSWADYDPLVSITSSATITTTSVPSPHVSATISTSQNQQQTQQLLPQSTLQNNQHSSSMSNLNNNNNNNNNNSNQQLEQTQKLRNLLTENSENILRDLLHSDPNECQDGGNNMLRKLLNDDDKSFRKEENKRKSIEQEDMNTKNNKRIPPAVPQQLAGQNPMLASMLAQTPKTLPAAPITIPTSIVSQVPQERLPKNLEKKLIHTPANQLLCITSSCSSTLSSSSASSSQQQHLITTVTGGIVTTSIQPPMTSPLQQQQQQHHHLHQQQQQMLRKNSTMLKSVPSPFPFIPTSPSPQQQQNSNLMNNTNNSNLMSNVNLSKISPDDTPSDPLLSVILEDVWSLQQEMNNIDNDQNLKLREITTPTPPAQLTVAPSPPVLTPTPPMSTSNQRTVMESSSDSMLYQILDDVILDPAPPNVVIPSSPPDLNDKLAISAIQRELMSLESSGSFYSNNNLGPPPAYSPHQQQHAPPQQQQQQQQLQNQQQMPVITGMSIGIRGRQHIQQQQPPPQQQRSPFPGPNPVSPQGFIQQRIIKNSERMRLIERRNVQMVNLQQQQKRLLAQQQQQQVTMQTPQEPALFAENMNEILNNSIAPNAAVVQINPRKQESSTTSTTPGSYPSSPASFASRSFPIAWQSTSSPSPPPTQPTNSNRIQQQNPMLNAQLSTNGFLPNNINSNSNSNSANNNSNNNNNNNNNNNSMNPASAGGMLMSNSNNDAGSSSAPPIPRRPINQRFSFPSPTSTPPASFPLFDNRPSIRQELRAVVGARSSSHMNDALDNNSDFFADLDSSSSNSSVMAVGGCVRMMNDQSSTSPAPTQMNINLLNSSNGNNKKSLLQQLLSEPP